MKTSPGIRLMMPHPCCPGRPIPSLDRVSFAHAAHSENQPSLPTLNVNEMLFSNSPAFIWRALLTLGRPAFRRSHLGGGGSPVVDRLRPK